LRRKIIPSLAMMETEKSILPAGDGIAASTQAGCFPERTG
jgi:hypothetical protein